MTTTLAEITETDVMRVEANHSLMVSWINADLFNRASHDVRKSIVLYDEHKMFLTALPPATSMSEPSISDRLAEFGVRYWSKGIV